MRSSSAVETGKGPSAAFAVARRRDRRRTRRRLMTWSSTWSACGGMPCSTACPPLQALQSDAVGYDSKATSSRTPCPPLPTVWHDDPRNAARAAPDAAEAPSKTAPQGGDARAAGPGRGAGRRSTPRGSRRSTCRSAWSTRSRRRARITTHEGRRRQMQYIGRLMRDIDPEPIRAALDALEPRPRGRAGAVRGRSSAGATRLLDDAGGSTEFVAAHPGSGPRAARARWCATRAPNARAAVRRTSTARCSAS